MARGNCGLISAHGPFALSGKDWTKEGDPIKSKKTQDTIAQQKHVGRKRTTLVQ
ncbi:hypothetical protein K3495_g6386 [Podosphaera aphanis]|nr:hypothetical protein K3495_g6386 [Podosphaera aphanis]